MRKIFFITGAGRCGTKLLTALLVGNNEFHVFPFEATNFFKNSLLENGLSNKIYLHSTVKLSGIFLDQITNKEFSGRKKVILNFKLKLKKKFKSKKFIYLNEFLEIILDSLYGDKKPVVINVHDENFLGILDIFKNSKIIHMLRNPLTQINSRYLFRFQKPQNYDGFEFSSSFYRNYNSFKNAYISLNDKRVLIVKMENLLKETKKEIKKILDFMSFKFDMINLLTTKSGKLFDSKKNIYPKNKRKLNCIHSYKHDISCLLPNDIYVISKIKYVNHFYKIQKMNFKKQSFVAFYLRHLGLIGKNRTIVINPWRIIKISIYSIYLYFLDKSFKNTFLTIQNK